MRMFEPERSLTPSLYFLRLRELHLRGERLGEVPEEEVLAPDGQTQDAVQKPADVARVPLLLIPERRVGGERPPELLGQARGREPDVHAEGDDELAELRARATTPAPGRARSRSRYQDEDFSEGQSGSAAVSSSARAPSARSLGRGRCFRTASSGTPLARRARGLGGSVSPVSVLRRRDEQRVVHLLQRLPPEGRVQVPLAEIDPRRGPAVASR